jgi:hypothetical protein
MFILQIIAGKLKNKGGPSYVRATLSLLTIYSSIVKKNYISKYLFCRRIIFKIEGFFI